MSKLSAFLKPAVAAEEKEIEISRRFLDEKGEPARFKIRAISQEENERITKSATRTVKVNGQPVERLDPADFSRRMVVAGTVEPDFSAREMCDAYGVMDPLAVPGKMLLSGEFSALLAGITALSGFDVGGLGDEAKNS